MFHLLKPAAAKTATYTLVGVLAIGLLIGAVRLASPLTGVFRSQVEGLLEEILGLDVLVGRFGMRLAGWIPRLTLEDVSLLCPESGQCQLSLKELRLDLSLVESIRHLEPHVESLTLVGAHLEVKRQADGSIVLVGLEGLEAGADPRVLTFFLTKGRFLLLESEVLWVDERAGAPPVHLSNVRLRFENTASRHRIGLIARLRDDPNSDIQLVADLRGAAEQPGSWTGDLYLRAQAQNLGPTLSGRLPSGLQIGSDSVLLESWSRLADSDLTDSINRISVHGAAIRRETTDGTTRPLRLAQLDALVRWERDGEGWGLDVADLVVTRDGVAGSPLHLSLNRAPLDGDGWSLQGGASGANLADLLAVGNLIPDLAPALARLQGASLRGALSELRLSIAKPPGEEPSWKLSGRGDDLALDPVEGLPGIAGLDFRFAANQERGVLTLGSKGLTLSQPGLFARAIVLDRLAGALHWYRDSAGRLQIEVPDLAAENDDVRTRSRLALMVPGDGAPPFLDLHTHFQVEDVSVTRRYVPNQRLKEKLVLWLDNAFTGGRIPEGDLLFRGVAADFPFDGQSGRFQILASLEGIDLTFHKEWPRLEDVVGELRFENRAMDIFASTARLLDSEVASAVVRIPDLSKVTAIEIEGRAEGPFADGLRILTETPLEKRLGGVGRAFDVGGRFRVDIETLSVPLTYQGRKGPLTLQGEISWPDSATLALARWDPLRLEELGGSLGFTESSVSAQAIEAKLWGQAVRLGVATGSALEGGGAGTLIEAKGSMPAKVLAQFFPSGLWTLVEGQADLDLRVNLDATDFGQTGVPLRFALDSGLVGAEVDLPDPLGKPKSARRPLRLEGALVPGGDLDARGRYGDLGLDLHLSRKDGAGLRLVRASLNLGGDARDFSEDGLRLAGSLDTLDLPAWQAWWEGRGAGGDSSEDGASLRSVDLSVKHLPLGELALEDVRLKAGRAPRHWDVRLDARELAGTIRIPHRPRSEHLRIHLDRLDLAGLKRVAGEAEKTAGNGKGRSDPRLAHTLEIRIDQLLWGENLLGSAAVDSSAIAGGVQFAPIRLAGKHASIEGKASWTVEDQSRTTRVELEGKSDDLGEFLRLLDDETPLHEAPATASLKLDWDGGPVDISPAALNGEIRLDVGQGSLLEVEPGVGRMLGILNLGALQRRLTLDFTDLFERGYAFEQIAGSLTIKKGQARIDDLFIEGPSARLEVSGRTDLVERAFDEVVTVIPRIGTGVALAGAVAGGPLVGAAVFLADKVTGGGVDKLGSYQYEITGPWDDPDIRRRGMLSERGVEQRFLPEKERAEATSAAKERPPAAPADRPTDTAPVPSDRRRRDETNHFLDVR